MGEIRSGAVRECHEHQFLASLQGVKRLVAHDGSSRVDNQNLKHMRLDYSELLPLPQSHPVPRPVSLWQGPSNQHVHMAVDLRGL